MLELRNIIKKFDQKTVLKEINLKVEKGEIIGIIGPSGCGKSTLLRTINLLCIPDSGDIVFEDKVISTKTSLTDFRKKIGMVFQQFNLFNNLTVIDNIILAPTKLGIMTEKDAQKRAMELLKKIDLVDKKDFYPYQLSGGQKQRVAIIRALIMNPKLMLFDEPTSSLDPEMIGEVTELMRQIAEEGMTMIIVSHEMGFIKNFASKIVFMDDGKIIKEGSPNEIFNEQNDMRLKEFLSKVNKV